MRTQEESAVKRDAETGRYFNETDEGTSQQPIEQEEEDSEQEDFEERRVEEQESEEEEDIGEERVDVEDEEAESSDRDMAVHKSVEQGEDLEQDELMESSSGSWETGDEDAELAGERSVTVATETAADIPVNRLVVVPDTDRRKIHEATKMSLRGQYSDSCDNFFD